MSGKVRLCSSLKGAFPPTLLLSPRSGSPEGLKVDLPSVKVPAVALIALPFQLPVRGRPSLGLEVFRGHKEIIN